MSCGYIILEGMCGKAEDVIVMPEVKALAVLLSVIDHGYGGYVIHHLPGLRVEQIIPAVATPIPVHEKERGGQGE